jgi:hypothetical protein
MKKSACLTHPIRLTLIGVFAAIVALASSASAQLPQSPGFAILAGTAVTCTHSTVIGDVGVSPGTAITRTACKVAGTLHPGDTTAEQAYLNFVTAFNTVRDHPPVCDETLTGTPRRANAVARRLLRRCNRQNRVADPRRAG